MDIQYNFIHLLLTFVMQPFKIIHESSNRAQIKWIQDLQRNVLTYSTTHKENEKPQVLSTLGLHQVSEKGQKTIKEEGRKEDRQEIEAKPFLESKRKFKRTSSKLGSVCYTHTHVHTRICTLMYTYTHTCTHTHRPIPPAEQQCVIQKGYRKFERFSFNPPVDMVPSLWVM